MNNIPQQNTFEQIQSLCRDFRRQLRSGARKRIEDYLDRVPVDSREMLFQNLLHIDIEFQRRQGFEPSSEDYLAHFPQYARLIRQAFFESTLMSVDASVETPDHLQTVRFDLPAARKLGEYELLRQIGRGAFGAVYKARHLQRNDIVALKTLPTRTDDHTHPLSDAERLHKFRREFRSLANVNHPNLIGMQTLEVDGGQWFFTMDLIDGVDFLDYVRPNDRLNQARLRAAARQLAQGIMALHQQHIVHRDLKPSNVMVRSDGHVVILDFGLVVELQPQSDQTVQMTQARFAGTPRYAAPEQAFGDPDAASDWYAFGVMLFEALTGRPPFGGSAAEIMVQKQNDAPPCLADQSELPADLKSLVDQLLRRDPRRRPDPTTIANTLSIAADPVSAAGKSSDSMSSLQTLSPLLVGRESQLQQLQDALHAVQSDRTPVVAFVSGLSGEGKTSLVDQFLNPLRMGQNVIVLSGRCYDRESVPFKAVDTLIDALVGFLRSRAEHDVLTWLPDDISMLAHLFPILRRVEAIAGRAAAKVSRIDDRQIRYRAFAALRELLINISRATPIAMFVDDLQWGDADSAEVLFELLSPPDAPVILFLGSYRSDEASGSPFLQDYGKLCEERDTVLKARSVRVTPLTEDQCLRLLAGRVGIDTATLREQAADLFRDTRGNPYFLEQLIEGFDAETGRFHPVPLSEIIARRLERLPDDAGRLLDVIAIAGQAVSPEEASRVAGHDTPMFSTLTHMRSERLVRLIGATEQALVDTYHDKIRETALAGLQESDRHQLHLAFGEMLERQEDVTGLQLSAWLEQDSAVCDVSPGATDRVYDLAYHFHAANDTRAFIYQLMAGELAFRAYASEDAIESLKRAAGILPRDAAATIRYRLWERLATSCARVRMFESALNYYEEAIAAAPSRLAVARAHLGVGRCYLTQGRFAEATRTYDLVLQELGLRRPESLMAMFEAVRLAFRVFLIPVCWQRPADPGSVTLAELEQEVHTDLAIYFFEQEMPVIQYLNALLSMAAAGIRTGRADRISRGLTHLASHMGQTAFPAVAKHLLNRSLKMTQHLPATEMDIEARGFNIASAAIVHANCRAVVRADAQFREAHPLLKHGGAHFSVQMAAHLHRHLLAVSGSSAAELEIAQEVLHYAEQTGDRRFQFYGHYDIASALGRAGDIEAAKREIAQARACLGEDRLLVSEAIFLATHGYVLLQASEYEAAQHVLEESWQLTKRRKLFMDHVIRAVPWLIESIVGPDWLNRPPLHNVKQLRQLCRIASVMYWFYPNTQSLIQRTRGRAFWLLGKRRKAIRCLASAVKCAERVPADYDLAKSLLDLAAVKEEGRDEMRRQAIALLKKQESVIPHAEQWLLGDQFDPACVAPVPDDITRSTTVEVIDE